MTIKHLQSIISQKLLQNAGDDVALQFFSVSGGSINETYRLVCGGRQFFCKINSAVAFPGLFEKEKKGLELIAARHTIRTPGVVDCFETGNYQVLLLEWINSGEKTNGFWKKFGEQLAALHANKSDYFGLDEDNYMGSIPQHNEKHANWCRFFIEKRLQPLVDECISKQLLFPQHKKDFENLYVRLPEIFSEDQLPSLLHGDLWNGNFICGENAVPFVIDPAAYYGHPSVDLGMTTLFGGFAPAFYEAYNYHSPFPKNHRQQWQVCNLYPLLVHLLLFGKSYLPQIEYSLIS